MVWFHDEREGEREVKVSEMAREGEKGGRKGEHEREREREPNKYRYLSFSFFFFCIGSN